MYNELMNVFDSLVRLHAAALLEAVQMPLTEAIEMVSNGPGVAIVSDGHVTRLNICSKRDLRSQLRGLSPEIVKSVRFIAMPRRLALACKDYLDEHHPGVDTGMGEASHAFGSRRYS